VGGSAVVGAVEFYQGPAEVGHVDYVLGRAYWGRGVMTEAVSAVIAWAFGAMAEVGEVRGCALSENVGSVRVMQKCGMVLEGTRRAPVPKFGEEREESTYVLTRARWREGVGLK
jgi:ribosomal-protein-alanine N-acetyltransferase